MEDPKGQSTAEPGDARAKWRRLTGLGPRFETLLAGHGYLWLSLALALRIYVPGQGHGLYRSVDARQAEVSREMLVSGNWAVPTLNGEVFLEKPPLFFACVALSYKLFGINEAAAHVPSAIFAVLSIMGLALLGKQLKDRRLGLFMALFLAADLYYLSWGREVRLDLALAAFNIWALLAFVRAYTPGSDRARFGPLLAFYALLTLSFLTKGVAGMLTPCLTVFFYLLARRDWRGFWRIKPWWGVVALVVITGGWHWELYRQSGWRYFEIFYLDNHLYRFIHGGGVNLGHHKPWHYYLGNEWHDLLPWSPLFPIVFLSFFRKGFRDWLGPDAFALVCSWIFPLFLFFSISSTKQSSYLLPIYGGYGAATGAWLLWKADETETPTWEKAYLLTYLWGAALAAVAIGPAALVMRHGFGIAPALLMVLPLAAGVVAVAAAVLHRFDPRKAMPAGLVALALAAIYGTAFIMPVVDGRHDLSAPSREIARLTASAPAVYVVDDAELDLSFLGFYCARPIEVLGLRPSPEVLPGPGERIPVAHVGASRKLIKRRRAALERAGMKIDVAFADETGKRHSQLWWVSPSDHPPPSSNLTPAPDPSSGGLDDEDEGDD